MPTWILPSSPGGMDLLPSILDIFLQVSIIDGAKIYYGTAIFLYLTVIIGFSQYANFSEEKKRFYER